MSSAKSSTMSTWLGQGSVTLATSWGTEQEWRDSERKTRWSKEGLWLPGTLIRRLHNLKCEFSVGTVLLLACGTTIRGHRYGMHLHRTKRKSWAARRETTNGHGPSRLTMYASGVTAAEVEAGGRWLRWLKEHSEESERCAESVVSSAKA